MTQGLKLVVLAAYLTSVYGVALPKEDGFSSSGGVGGPTGGESGPSSTGSHGNGYPTTSSTKTSATKTKTSGGGGYPTGTGMPGGSGKGVQGPVIDKTFPNPCLIQVKDTWYSFATSYNGKHIQMAKSTDFENWTYLDKDAMPQISSAKWIAQKGDLGGSNSTSTGSYSMPHSTYSMSHSGTHTKSSSSSSETGYPTNYKRDGYPESSSKSHSSSKTKTSSETGYPTSSSHSGQHSGTHTTTGGGSYPTGGPGGPGGGDNNYVKIRKPDVIQTPDGKFVMQFTSRHEDSVRRCIGVAQADDIEGPYVPSAQPFHCEDDLDGGDFDSAFYQEGSKLYMVYNRRSSQQEDDTPADSSSGGMGPTSTHGGQYPTSTHGGQHSTSTSTGYVDKRAHSQSSSTETDTYPTGTATSSKSKSHSSTQTKSGEYPTGTGTGMPPGSTGRPYRPSELSLMEIDTSGQEWGMKALNGTTKTLLQSEESDTPGVSAPYLIKVKDVYFLTFSTGAYNSSAYNIEYATSSDLTSTFKRASKPLLQSNDFPKLDGPGAASFSKDGTKFVFQNREPAKDGGSGGGGIFSSIQSILPTFATSTRSGAGPQRSGGPNERRAESGFNPGGVLPPIGGGDSGKMSRLMWVGNVEIDGETMKVGGGSGGGQNGTHTGTHTGTHSATHTSSHTGAPTYSE